MDARLVVRYAVREILSLAGMGVALFWSAGRIDWWPGWAALIVNLIWLLGTALVIVFLHPDLLAERLGPRKGARKWDAAIISLLGLISLACYILAGLDQRYGWSNGFSPNAQMAALIVCAFSYDVLFLAALAANRFFSQIVRIQLERGHAAVSAGPYHFVRHPAYLGAVLYALAVPVLLASWPALFVNLLSAGLLIARTALEDRTLRAELSGYAEYAQRVRYRLIPGIW